VAASRAGRCGRLTAVGSCVRSASGTRANHQDDRIRRVVHRQRLREDELMNSS
jgi:hypothetical protein